MSVLRCFDPEYAKNDKYKKITNNPCVVGMVSGLGLVNAAMSTQLLFTEFSPDNFIIGGVAGSIRDKAENRDTFNCPCDVVVPSLWAITDLQVSMPTATPSDPVPLEGIDYTREPPAEYMYQCPAEQIHLTWVEPSHLIQGNGKVTKQMFWDADPRLMEIAKEVASNVTSSMGLGGFTQLETKLMNCTSQCRNFSTVRVGNTNRKWWFFKHVSIKCRERKVAPQNIQYFNCRHGNCSSCTSSNYLRSTLHWDEGYK